MRLILQQQAWQAGYQGDALARIAPHTGCIATLAQTSVHERDIVAHSHHGSQAAMRSNTCTAGAEEAPPRIVAAQG